MFEIFKSLTFPEFFYVTGLFGNILGLLFLVILILLITFKILDDRDRDYFIRIASIILVVSLALCANNIFIYIVVIFIIATGITRLEFLLKLAAILRGGEGATGYFDYLKKVPYAEALPREEIEEEKTTKIERVEKRRIKQAEDIVTDLKNIAPWALEELILRQLERKYNSVIKRQVEIGKFEVDGVMALDSKRDAIIEVKIKYNPALLPEIIKKLVRVAKYYKSVYNREVVVFLVFGKTEEKIPERVFSIIKEIKEKENIEIYIEFVDLNKLII